MGHNIQAIVAKASQFSADPSADTAKIALPQDYAMVLATEYEGLDSPPDLGALADKLSTGAAAAHVATAYHGGSGSQAAAVWSDGAISQPLEEGTLGTINGALSVIGVRRTSGLDEFDSIGLGRYRSHETWRNFARTGKASYERKALSWNDWFDLIADRSVR